MSANSVIVRDLRRLSRRRSTFVRRCVIGAVLLLIVLVGSRVVEWGMLPAGIPGKGKAMLIVLSLPLLFISLVLGVGTTADCLSEERRGGTLGLLFLTHLSHLDLLLGRLVSTSLTVIYGLVATLPMLSISLLYGGVLGGELWRLAIVLLNSLFLSVCVGLFVSSFSLSARRALTNGFALMAFVVGGPFLVAVTGVIRGAIGGASEVWLLLLPSPFFALMKSGCLNSLHYDPWMFTLSLATSHAIGWLFLVAARGLLARSFRRSEAVTKVVSNAKVDPGPTESKRPSGISLSKFGRDRRSLVVLFVTCMIVVASVVYFGIPNLREASVWLLLFTAGFLKLWWLVEVFVKGSEARSSGQMEMLLTTPLGMGGWLRMNRRSLLRQFVTGLALLLVAVLALRFRGEFLYSLKMGELLVAGVWLAMVLLVADLWAMWWGGLWNAVTARTFGRGLIRCVLVIFGIPALLTTIGLIVFPWTKSWFRSDATLLGRFPSLWVWFWSSLVVSGAYGLWCSVRFRRLLPVLAAHDFQLRSAEGDRLEQVTRRRQQRTGWMVKIPWPVGLGGQVLAIGLLSTVFLVLGTQVRRSYLDRVFKEELLAVGIPQREYERGAESTEANWGAVPYFAAVMMANLPLGGALGASYGSSSRQLAFEFALQTAQSRFEKQQALDRFHDQHVELLKSMPDQFDPSEHDQIPLASFEQASRSQALLLMLGAEVEYLLLQGEVSAAVNKLEGAYALGRAMSNKGAEMVGVRLHDGVFLRLRSALRSVLANGECSVEQLDKLERQLSSIETAASATSRAEAHLQYTEAYKEGSDVPLVGQSGFQNEVACWMDWGQRVSGGRQREWIDFLRWSREFLEAASALDRGYAATYLRVTAELPVQSWPLGWSPALGLKTEMVRNVESGFQSRAWIRIQRCAIALEKIRAATGDYPASLAALGEPLPELALDPFTGQPFLYEREGDEYLLSSRAPIPDGTDPTLTEFFKMARKVYWRMSEDYRLDRMLDPSLIGPPPPLEVPLRSISE